MRYKLNVHPAVRDYLHNYPGLTRKGRNRLYAGLNDVAELSDGFRSNPVNRLRPGSPYLLYHHLFLDAGRLRTLTLAADDSGAAYGVLVIDYAEIQ